MKKIICGISMALLTVVLALCLAGCNTDGKIKKAFEKEGYSVTASTVEENESAKAFLSVLLTEDEMKDANKYGVITVSKSLNSGVIIQFPSTGKLKETLNKNDDKAYDNAKDKGYVNGNCYLISIFPEVVNIFKNA